MMKNFIIKRRPKPHTNRCFSSILPSVWIPRSLWIIFLSFSSSHGFLAAPQIHTPFEKHDQLFKEQTNVYPLTNGSSSSKIYKIFLEEEYCVLKINDINLTKKNHRELYHQFKAAEKGLSPKIYFASEDSSIILMEYIPGKTSKSKVSKQHNIIKMFSERLQSIHSIPVYPFPQKPIFDRMKELHANLIEKNLSFSELDAAVNKLEDLHKLHKQFIFEKVTVHGDLHQGNLILRDEEIFFLDWEKAGYEDPFYDLCSFALCHDFNQVEEEILLTCYLGRPPVNEEKERYALNKHMSYCYFALELFSVAYDVAEKGERIFMDSSSTNEWSYYVDHFEHGANFSAKFLYDFGICALSHFINFATASYR